MKGRSAIPPALARAYEYFPLDFKIINYNFVVDMLIEKYGPFHAFGYKFNPLSMVLLQMIEELAETENKVNAKIG